ncbi:MAG: type II toxin-antitoxin system RelE/ParE family toxin [Trueperaceae bacterium]|nr:type II toxin-antitoxin system RelE/ParE family toxin [Trueperaceae bacterium]
MSHAVLLTDGAARDLDELYAEAYDRGGVAHADHFLDRIQVCLGRIAEEAPTGGTLPELHRLGLDDARVLRDGDLRFVYRLRIADALVVLIAHERRSLQSLLQRRTLDS